MTLAELIADCGDGFHSLGHRIYGNKPHGWFAFFQKENGEIGGGYCSDSPEEAVTKLRTALKENKI